MMVARGPGAVGCAHCTNIGADLACRICGHLICDGCAADWTTCSEPSGRAFRLGTSARLRDVDPSGHLGLVSHWIAPLRLFDMRRLRWVDAVELPRSVWLTNRPHPPRLTSDGYLLYADFAQVTSDSAATFIGIRRRNLRDGGSALIETDPAEHGTAVTAMHDVYSFVTQTQKIALIRHQAAIATMFEPLPRKVIHAGFVDAERMLLVAGSWCELTIHRIVADTLDRVDPLAVFHSLPIAARLGSLTPPAAVKPATRGSPDSAGAPGSLGASTGFGDSSASGTSSTSGASSAFDAPSAFGADLRSTAGTLELAARITPKAVGDVTWVALAGGWLVAAVTVGSGATSIEIRRVDEIAGGRLSVGPVVHTHAGHGLRAASLSRDGRFLAFALDRELVVHEIGTQNQDSFDEHTDRINLVRFVGPDHMLVSADNDNRVVMRPRTPGGYAVPLVEVEITDDEGVPL